MRKKTCCSQDGCAVKIESKIRSRWPRSVWERVGSYFLLFDRSIAARRGVRCRSSGTRLISLRHHRRECQKPDREGGHLSHQALPHGRASDTLAPTEARCYLHFVDLTLPFLSLRNRQKNLQLRRWFLASNCAGDVSNR